MTTHAELLGSTACIHMSSRRWNLILATHALEEARAAVPAAEAARDDEGGEAAGEVQAEGRGEAGYQYEGTPPRLSTIPEESTQASSPDTSMSLLAEVFGYHGSH